MIISKRYLHARMYNYYVPFYRRVAIMLAFAVGIRFGGWVLWKVAPYSLVG